MKLCKSIIFMSGLLVILPVGVVFFFFQKAYLPKPSGPYSVGTMTEYWTDTSRKEPRNKDINHPFREIGVTLYYPAEVAVGSVPVLYMQKKLAMLKEKLLGACAHWPVLKNINLVIIYTNSYQNVPLVRDVQAEKMPLIIFSHGLTGIPDAYTVYCEELASKGYIVVALHHTYACEFVCFPDGRRAFNTINFDGVWYQKKEEIRTREQKIWQHDVSFVLDKLTELDQESTWFLAGAIDYNNIGIAGHSFGGSTAIQAARHDKRFKAAVNLDGGLFGDKYLEPFATPSMHILNDEGDDNATDEQLRARGYASRDEWRAAQLRVSHKGIEQLVKTMQADAYQVKIKYSTHGTFSDDAVYGKLFFWMKWLFNCDKKQAQAHALSVDYMNAFFDNYLKQQKAELFEEENSLVSLEKYLYKG